MPEKKAPLVFCFCFVFVFVSFFDSFRIIWRRALIVIVLVLILVLVLVLDYSCFYIPVFLLLP